MSTTNILSRLFAPGVSEFIERMGDEVAQARAGEAEALLAKEKAQRDAAAAESRSRDALQRVQLAIRSLKRAAPGIVLSSLGFAFAFGADGDGRVALMALLLFVAGTAAYVSAIGLTSGRLKPDSGPGTHDRSA